jgi:hypothetical protein
MELKQKIKKIKVFLILIFICLCSKVSGQITLYKKLQVLSKSENKIEIKKNTNIQSYVKLGQKGIIPIYNSPNNNYKLFAVYFGRNENLIFYILMTENEIYKSNNNMTYHSNTILMYDKTRNFIFFIEYGMEGSSILKKENNHFDINNDFEQDVSRIVKVDEKFNPESVLCFEYYKENILYSKERYYKENEKWMKRKYNLKNPVIKFNNLTYDSFLLSLRNFDKNYFITTNCSESDNYMFFKFN